MSRLLRVARGPEAALFALVLGVYAYFYQAGGWNQNSRFDLTRTLVEDHSVVIDRLANNTGDTAKTDHVFCDKAPGISIAGAVPYQLVHVVYGPERPSPGYLGWTSWLATVFAVGVPSAFGVVALALLLGALGVAAWARFALAAAWGLATLALPYSTLYYGHQVCASLLVVALALCVRRTPSRGGLVAIGALCGWAVVVEYPAAVGVIAICLYAWRVLGWRALPWIVLGGVGPAIVLAAYHTAAFGAPWQLAYAYSTQNPRHVGFMGIGVPDLTVLQAILVSSFRGVLFSAPWLALALPGAWRLWRAGARAETIVCSVIVIVFLWMNASLVDWNGGWAVGPRYLVPCLPFAVVLVAGWFVGKPLRSIRFRRVALAIAGALVAWSLALQLAATAVRPEVDVGIEHPFGDFIWPHAKAGELATNTQSIDMKGPGRPGNRAAWNIGEKIGLSGFASLVPLALWCGGFGFLLVRRVRRTPAAS